MASASERLGSRLTQVSGATGKPSAARAFVNVIPSEKVVTAGFPKPKVWYLLNLDTRETLFGQFEADELQRSIGAAYANTFALNRQKAITQFLHGNVETMSFTARYYALFAFHDIRSRVDKLMSWARRDSELGRPPILYFWVGDQHAKMTACVLTAVDVRYDRPGFVGTMQGATVSVTLQKYDEFRLGETATFDTLYYHAKLGDTYELIAAQQYRNPLLGVELRQRHPQYRRLRPGDLVKVPAPTGSIRTARVEPKSITFSGILDRRSNPHKTRLAEVLKLRNKTTLGYKTIGAI